MSYLRLLLPLACCSTRLCDHAEVKDLLAYLTLAVKPSDVTAFKRAVAAPRRGVGDVAVAAIVAHASTKYAVVVWFLLHSGHRVHT